MKLFQRYGRDVLRALRRENFDRAPNGDIAMFGGSARLGVWWLEGIKGQPESFTRTHNLVPDDAILDILNVYFGPTAKHSAWYIAPYSGNVAPAANWTGANFTANATEIVSTTEGFSEVTRQQFNPGTPAAGKIDNLASLATFTIVCTTTINIYGAGLLSVNTRGGVTGILASAVKFATVRVANNGDPWQCGYEVSLIDS